LQIAVGSGGAPPPPPEPVVEDELVLVAELLEVLVVLFRFEQARSADPKTPTDTMNEAEHRIRPFYRLRDGASTCVSRFTPNRAQ
jgi:hypothetical protein